MPRKKEIKSTITPEELLANGWKKREYNFIPFQKRICYKKGLGYIILKASDLLEGPLFDVNFPGGGSLLIYPKSIEELNAFEKMILSYEP